MKLFDNWLYQLSDKRPFWEVYFLILALSIFFGVIIAVYLIDDKNFNLLVSIASLLGGLFTVIGVCLAINEYRKYTRDRALEEKVILHFEVAPKLLSFEKQIFNIIQSAIWLYQKKEVDKTSIEEHKKLEVEFSTSIKEANRLINKISYLNRYKKDEYDALKERFDSITVRIQDDIRCVENDLNPSNRSWLPGRYNLKKHSLNNIFHEILSAIEVGNIIIFTEEEILEKVPDVKKYFDDYKNVIEELKNLS